MPCAFFLKVSGASGESKNKAYSGWTELDSITWSMDQPYNVKGGGLSGGQAEFREFSVTFKMDKVVPALAIKCSTGEHLDQVTITGAKMGGDQVEFFKHTMDTVMVTSLQFTGANGSEMMVHAGFQCAKFKNEYSEQTDKGGKGATSTFGYNIKENTKA